MLGRDSQQSPRCASRLDRVRRLLARWGFGAAIVAVLATGSGCPFGDNDDTDDAKDRPKPGEAGFVPSAIELREPTPRSDSYPSPNVATFDTSELWNLINTAEGKQRVLVTLKDDRDERGYFNGRVLIHKDDYAREKNDLLREIDGITAVVDRPITLASGARLPLFEATVASERSLSRLRALPAVDFVEPALTPINPTDSALQWSSCDARTYDPSSENPRAVDDRLPGPYPGEDLVPYVYKFHGVQDAWARFGPRANGRPLPGAGQGVAVLDTGISHAQQQFFDRWQFFDQFAAQRGRRPVLELNETHETGNDECFHGTKIASITSAPRDGRSVVGIAWGADLTSVKVTNKPLVEWNGKCEKARGPVGMHPTCVRFAESDSVSAVCQGIAAAVRPPDGRPPAKVIAMALGALYPSPTITDCIKNAYYSSPNTLFVAAAGTGTSYVVFPANLDPYVLAVSMTASRPGRTDYQLISDGPKDLIDWGPAKVGYGSEVDFVSAYDTDSHVPAAGPVGNDSEDAISKFAMSSASTGIYAGLLALAAQYADEQKWTRDQLVAALTLASSRATIVAVDGKPPPPIFGAGILDVYRATGGARHAAIAGPTKVLPGTQVRLRGSTDAVVPPRASPPTHFAFHWTVNGGVAGNGPTALVEAPSSGSLRVELVVEDRVDGNRLTASHEIQTNADVPAAKRRTLYWTSFVSDHATFFNGGRHDHVVNAGALMPGGCLVETARGLPMISASRPLEGASPQQTWEGKGAGFTVTRPGGTQPNSLEALVHQWHDGLNAVRTKVVYDVLEPSGVDCAVPGVLASSP